MAPLRFVILFGILSLPKLATASEIQLALTEKGVAITAGAFARYGIAPPEMSVQGEAKQKPTYKVTGPTGAEAVYPNGTVLKYTLEPAGGIVRFHYTNASPKTKNFRFDLSLPTKLGSGGQYSLDDGALKPFPRSHAGEQFVAKGNGRKLTVVDPLGEGFTVATPGGWHAIQDNRKWNWDIFLYQYQFDTGGKPEGRFQLKFESWQGAAQAGTAGAAAETPRRFLLDRFGQSARHDYPAKIKSADELKQDAAREASETRNAPPWDRFGGLEGTRERYGLKKTGYFHVENAAGRQVLVSPEGNLFFHLGVCTLASVDDYTKVKGRETHYESLPEKKGEYATAWRPKDDGVYSFYIGNLITKYGEPYERGKWLERTIDRLRSWGFNSAGAFTEWSPVFTAKNFPYVKHLGGGASGTKSLPGKIGAGHILDPFAPGTEEALDQKFAESLAADRNNPLIIGYFLGNEQHFENLPKLIPSYTSSVAAKLALVDSLERKHGNIEAFNRAWKPANPFGSFSELKDAPLFVRTPEAAADMQAFFELYLDKYYASITKALRKHAPNHLILGSRWTPGTASNETVVRTAGKYLDILSVNYYTYVIESDFLKRVHAWGAGKPVILSEWHYSAVDEGLGGAKEVKSQQERGLAYRNYVEQSAALPFVVGSEWFSYIDQSITGRFFEGFNGEGNNIGLVNVVDRPYTELVAMAGVTNRRIYDVMLGKEAPFQFDDPRFRPGSGKSTKTVSAPPAMAGLKLDGTTTNWPGRPAEPIESANLVLGTPNPHLRGDFRLCWDRDNLYFFIQIKDPTPMINQARPQSFWYGDCVELFIGAENLSQGGTMLFSDRQIFIAAKEEPAVHVVDHPDEGAKCKVVAVKDVAGDGYVLEAAIPFSVLGFTPKPGMEILFDVAIDNQDVAGKERKQQLVWNGTSKNSADRAAWGRARIVEN